MNRSTFSVLFYVNKGKVKNGIAPVMGRITINGTQSQFSCKRSIPLTMWDVKGNCAKGRNREALDLNRNLDNIKAQIIKHYQHLSDRDAFVTAEMVRNAYQGFGSEYETLLGAFDKDIANLKRRVGKDRALGTYKLQVRSRNYVADFLQMNFRRTYISMQELTPDFIKEFAVYLANDRHLAKSTIWLTCMHLKGVVGRAHDNGKIQRNVFAQFHISPKCKERTFLTEEELKAVMAHEFEETPHLHATIVPIVMGERKKQKKELAVKKRYRTKAPAPRLCADEVMSRANLIRYQDTYAEQMTAYRLQRGIKGSEAQHISTHEYYRSLIAQGEDLQANITQLLAKANEAQRTIDEAKEAKKVIDEATQARQELVRIKAEAKTEELKNSATKTATAALNGINSLLGGNKVNRLEKENKELRNEVEDLNGQIERLHADMQKMKDDHAREMNRANEQHQQEVNNLKRILEKAYQWFPSFKRFLNMERECLECGFNMEQTEKLLYGQCINYSGWLHSNEYRRNALANDVTAQVIRDEKRNLFLHINEMPITQWFKEQFGIGQEQRRGIKM